MAQIGFTEVLGPATIRDSNGERRLTDTTDNSSTASSSLSLRKPLRVPIFRNLLVADLVSDIGTFMQNVGAAWLRKPRCRYIPREFALSRSEHAQRQADPVSRLQPRFLAELTVLHVLEEIPGLAKTEALAAATEQLNKLIPPEVRKTFKIKTAVRIGKPHWEIIQFALEEQTDLVTMGVRGRGALDRAVFGSTTYRVMQLGPCPVLAVHV